MLFRSIQKFEACYLEMGGLAMMPQICLKKGKASGLKKLIHQTQSSDEDEDMRDSTPALPDSAKSWRADFMNYIDTVEAKLPPGMSTIQWWGVCTYLYLDCLFLLLTHLFEDQCQAIWTGMGINHSDSLKIICQ